MATLKREPERGEDGVVKSHMQVHDHELRKAAGCWMPNQQADGAELKPQNGCRYWTACLSCYLFDCQTKAQNPEPAAHPNSSTEV